MTKRRWQVNMVTENRFVDAPPGLIKDFHTSSANDKVKRMEQEDIWRKASRNTAMQPGKNIMMTLFMMWMSGSSVNIFSIMITMYTAFGALSGFLQVNKTFKRFSDFGVETMQDKAIYCLIQFGVLCIALYKCNSLGILPITISDWGFRYAPLKALELTTA